MASLPEYVQTNVSLTPRQREKLKAQEKLTDRSMSQIIRDLIEEKYPDAPPYQPAVDFSGQRLHYQKKDATVEEERRTDEDFRQLANGWSPELRMKFKIK